MGTITISEVRVKSAKDQGIQFLEHYTAACMHACIVYTQAYIESCTTPEMIDTRQ